ncbi:hypothetical protein JCM1840_003753 [Sporobolomyces johnsonii]
MAATPLSSPLAAAQRLRLIASHLSRSAPGTASSSRSFSSSLHNKLADRQPQWSFTTASSFRGKPGSPVYTPAGSQPAEQPATKKRRTPLRLQQGLAADHPLVEWRDKQLERCPWGAGHDWFFVEGLPLRSGGEVRGGEEEGGKETVEGTRGVVMGVADGVGGWEDSGVDPSHFAQALMWFARERVRTGRALTATGEPSGRGLKELLEGAFEDVLAEKGIVAGSSTACLVALDAETGKLHAANLGDSSFLILRPARSNPLPTPPASPSSSPDSTTPPAVLYKLLHAQPPQIHFFNAPRQLAKLPPSSSSEGALVDSPRDADATPPEGIQLEEGDVVVVATDGFGDNVFSEGELEQLVALVRGKADESVADADEAGEHAQAQVDRAHLLAASVAQTAVNFARLVSFKEDKVTPFEVEARRWGYRDLKGGKVDDVTVVVAVVGRR